MSLAAWREGGMGKPRNILTVAQAAKRLRCARATVARLAGCGAFPGAVLAATGWLIPDDVVEAQWNRVKRRPGWQPRKILASTVARQVRAEPQPVLTPAPPRTRAQCQGASRPCLHLTCRYSLYADIDAAGSLVLNSNAAPEAMVESCALDVAERGPLPPDRVAALLGVDRRRVRQIEAAALRKLGEVVRAHPLTSAADVIAAPRAQPSDDVECVTVGELDELLTVPDDRDE